MISVFHMSEEALLALTAGEGEIFAGMGGMGGMGLRGFSSARSLLKVAPPIPGAPLF